MRFIKPQKTGTPYIGENYIFPKTHDIIIPKDTYISENLTIIGDEDLVPEKIAWGRNIFGVYGEFCDGYETFISDSVTEETIICDINERNLVYNFNPISVYIRHRYPPSVTADDVIMQALLYESNSNDGSYHASGFITTSDGQNFVFLNSYDSWYVGQDYKKLEINKGVCLNFPLGNQPIFDVNIGYEIVCQYPTSW